MEKTLYNFEVVASYFNGTVTKKAVVTAETREEAAMQAVITHALPIDHIKGAGPICWNDFHRQMQRSANKTAWPQIVSSDGDEVILAWGDEDSAQTLLLVARAIEPLEINEGTGKLNSDQLREEIEEELREEMEEELREQIEEEFQEQVEDLRNEVAERLSVPLEEELQNKVDDLREQMEQDLREQVEEELQDQIKELRQEIAAELRLQMEQELRERVEAELRSR